MSLINTPVQPFKTTAFHNGEFVEVTDGTLKGKWSVLIFMPAAFTFNCPTEVEDAAANYAALAGAGMPPDTLAALAANSIEASFAGDADKERMRARLADWRDAHGL